VGRLERVEVVKGACSALYGSDAIGGVVNLVTRDPERPFEGSLVASGGSLGAVDSRGDAGFVRGRWRGFVSLERHQSDGFDLSPTTPDTTGAGFRRHDGYGKLRLQASPSLALSAFANGYWNDSTGRSVGELGLQESEVAEDAKSYGLAVDWRASARTGLLARGFSLAGAYAYLDAEDRATGLALTNRNGHTGVARLAWERRRTGTRANLRGSFHSSWVAARATAAGRTTDAVAPAFLLWDLYLAQRVRGGLEAFAAVDNLTGRRDPNAGRLAANGQPLPVYRAEAGRTFRVGLRIAAARGGN
jgi:outer membrane receptor protein involved in Fe transport